MTIAKRITYTAAAVMLVAAVAATALWLSTEPPPSKPRDHAQMVSALRAARRDRDLGAAVRAQAELAHEAFTAAARTARAWMALRAEMHGLLPRALTEDSQRYWNYADVAADCYAHLVIAAHVVAPDLLPGVKEMLEIERHIDPPFYAVRLSNGKTFDDGRRIFGAVEYAKDGLLAILESLGESEWSQRLEQVVAGSWEIGAHRTRTGAVLLQDAEKNGEMLQVLARLWHRRHDPQLLNQGRAIVDAYLGEVLPKTDGMPPEKYDFDRGEPSRPNIKLRDHGNEVIAGLVEWSLVEKSAGEGRWETYRAPIERMLDRLLEVGRRPDGLWLNSVGEHSGAKSVLNDNWGYISSAFYAYGDSLPKTDPRRQRYLGAARKSLIAVAHQHDANWEWGGMDGYADTIEGALYLIKYFPRAVLAARWVDDEIGNLFRYARPDGFVGRTYLDGNFIRTSLLYALWKTAGIRLDPWRDDLRLGAERDGAGWRVFIAAQNDWNGVVRFDRPRHREVLHLPRDYPRLNGWPEWFAPQSKRPYRLENLETGTRRTVTGRQLQQGIPLRLSSGQSVEWRIAASSQDDS